jgi:hypothetical protein
MNFFISPLSGKVGIRAFLARKMLSSVPKVGLLQK